MGNTNYITLEVVVVCWIGAVILGLVTLPWGILGLMIVTAVGSLVSRYLSGARNIAN